MTPVYPTPGSIVQVAEDGFDTTSGLDIRSFLVDSAAISTDVLDSVAASGITVTDRTFTSELV